MIEKATTSISADHPFRIRTGVIFIGLMCVVILCLITPYNDYYVGNTFLAGNHFPIGPICILVLITFLNFLLRRILPKYAFTPGELITIWCMSVAASGLPSSGMMRYLIPALVSYEYYATPENEWANLFHQYIPDWIVVTDKHAIRAFFEGIDSSETIPWAAWFKPLLIWTLFLAVFYFAIFCLTLLLRKQWIEHEKLSFPLVQLPLQIVQPTDGGSFLNAFFRDRLVWLGASIPFVLHLLNGLHAHFPAVPQLQTWHSLDPILVEKPWSAMRPFPMYLFLSVVGFSYLLTLDVSFSLWFFFLFCRFQYLLADIFGTRFQMAYGGFSFFARSFTASQEMGAALMFVCLALWNARSHIRDLVGKLLSTVEKADREARWAILGFILAVDALIGFHKLIGMTFPVAFGIVLLTFAEYIALTWLVVHGGMLLINPSFGPNNFLITMFGSSRLGPANVTAIFLRPRSLRADLREFMMPNVMNALKVSDSLGLRRTSLLLSMGGAILLGLTVSYYSYIHLAYARGASNMGYVGWSGVGSLREIQALLVDPSGTNKSDTFFIALGGLVMAFLMWMRRRFLWWPFHPIGYATLSSWATMQLWFSIFVGWLIKSTLIKFGGLKAYRRLLPFFLGMVMGESLMAGFWIIIGLISGVGYRILPG